MNIALIGYGKMGKAIEEIALQNGHEIVLKISIENTDDMTAENLKKADVAIEFTGPESAANNLKEIFNVGVPVVCGSTGWLEQMEEIQNICLDKGGALVYASNFSIGVNLFFELNNYLARLMNGYDIYNPKWKKYIIPKKRCTKRNCNYVSRTNIRKHPKKKTMGKSSVK
jgi:4-hydroxy-tetrahydrodipicolinate reductase